MSDSIGRLFASFRDSVLGLFNSDITADDVRGLFWIAALGTVVVIVLSVLRGLDKRRPMGR